MCHSSVLEWGIKNLSRLEIRGKRILEVGSRDVNGSLRYHVCKWGPREYVGIDIVEGRGVDVICSAENMINHFGSQAFDIVICTEVLEHVKDWKTVVSNIKNICKPGGIVLITTRSKGFPRHDHPSDFWRYQVEDIQAIFSDLELLVLAKDPQFPGVFLKARRTLIFNEKDLSTYNLHSIE